MRKQCIIGSEATRTKRQHTRPCSDCPFARRSLRGWLGRMSAPEWMSLAHGEGRSDCHTKVGPCGEPRQCAGLAIYRANVCKSPPGGLIRLPVDHETVFSRPDEFLEHHRSSTREWLEYRLSL